MNALADYPPCGRYPDGRVITHHFEAMCEEIDRLRAANHDTGQGEPRD